MDPKIPYLAGLIDGEGHIGQYGQRTVILEISMCHRPTIEWLQCQFGGGIYTPSMPRTVARQYWKWSASADVLRQILPQVLPYVITKQEHVQIAIELLELRSHRSNKRYEPLRQDELSTRLKELNRRGR